MRPVAPRPTRRPLLRRVAALCALLLAGAVPCAALPPVLRVVMPADHAEAFFALANTPKELPGFDYEILEDFTRLHKIELQVLSSPTWDGLVPMLLEGKADLIAGGFTDTIERRKKIDFTVEVFPTRDVVVTRKPHAPVTSLEQLRAMRVITHRGTSMVESLVAAGVPLASISYVGKGTVEDALEERQADAGVLGLEVAILARRANPELELGLFLGEPGSLAYGLRKGDTELRQALDTYLANRRRTATWGRLVVKYFGENALEILKAARKPSS